MKLSNLILILVAAAALVGSTTQPTVAQSDRYWRNGISPYAEGPSGTWKEEKLGPRPRNSYEYRRSRPRGYFTSRPRVYYAPPPPPVYRGRFAVWSPEWYAYCARKYRSFNPRTGYFLAYSGRYRFCR